MPSLHTAWSAWCALVLMSLIRPWWGKALVLLYPAVTIFAIVVTANHYFSDVIAGLLLVGVCLLLLARIVTTRLDRASATAEARIRDEEESLPVSLARLGRADRLADRSATGPAVRRGAAQMVGRRC